MKTEDRAKLVLLFTLPILIYGLVNGYLLKLFTLHPLVQFIIEMLMFTVVPCIIYWYLFSKKILSLVELGLNLNNKRQVIEDGVVCVVIFFASIRLLWSVLWFFLWQFDWVRHANPFSYDQMLPKNGIFHLIVALYFSITAALVEEVYFRGTMKFSIFTLIPNKKIAQPTFIIISSLLFGLVHSEGGLTAMFVTFLIGIITARLYLWAKNLYPLIFAHFISDFISFL